MPANWNLHRQEVPNDPASILRLILERANGDPAVWSQSPDELRRIIWDIGRWAREALAEIESDAPRGEG